ncbi:JAB domain-containing protein [Sorangium sp. So ce134]
MYAARSRRRRWRRAAVVVLLALELGRRYYAARTRRGELLTDAARVARYFGPRLASLEHEELWIAALDSHGRVRETRLRARGGAGGLYVGRATVLRTALDMAVQSFVLAHNHPSGEPDADPRGRSDDPGAAPLPAELHVPLTAHVLVTPSGRYAAVHE